MKKLIILIFLFGIYYNSESQAICPVVPHGSQKPKNPPKNGTPVHTEVIFNRDPNLIIGPAGIGANKWVSIHDRLAYQILCENDTSATAPVKVVKIIYPIDQYQDINTFQLGSFGLNNLTFNIPNTPNAYYQRLDARDSLGLYIDVTAGIDAVNRQAFWIFESIDPVTQLATNDPLKGLLLTQDNTRPAAGHGFVNFTIKPISSSHTGDTISAIASIVFDTNDTIPTNRTKNTIDALPPTTHLGSAVEKLPGASVKLSWHANDDPGGSGVSDYSLYVAAKNKPFVLAQQGISDTFFVFSGSPDSSYCFFVSGRDSTGNQEPFSNNCDLSVTLSATGCIAAAPAITASGNTTFCTGENVILSTTNAGPYQWFKDGVPLPGATSSAYTATVSGSYTLRAGFDPCTATSSAITVVVNTSGITPVITSSGVTSFCPGGFVTLSTNSTAALQWFKNSVLIPGAVNKNYVASQSGNYAVRAGTGACAATSAAISVNVIAIEPPVITASGNTTFCQGTSILLSSSASGNLQWFNNGTAIPGANGQSFTVTQSGNYTLQLAVNNCIANSNAISVIVSNSAVAPTVTASGPATFCQGGNVTLSTNSSGILQWIKDGADIPGATGSTYNVSISGSYSLRSGTGICAATSTAILITVTPLPAAPVINASGSTSFCQGGNVILSTITAGPLQWIKDGTDIAGATGQSYTATQSGNYSVRAGTAPCISTSALVAVTVSPLPAAPTVTAAGSTTICQGANVILSTTATGTLQWLKDGTAINGANGQSYTVTTAGNYAVRSGVLSCAVTSAVIPITVTPLPVAPVVTASGAATFCQGQSLSLSSSATTGNQWYKDGNLITGATAPSFTVNQQGNYSVVATANNCASLPSSPVIITVTPLPAKPVITVNLNLLSSSSATGNQWFFNGMAIAGATGQQHDGAASGQYSVSATINGCTMSSDAFNFTFIPNPDLITISDVAIYPNPVKDNLIIANKANRKLLIRIFNMLGVMVYSGNIYSLTGTIPMGHWRNGTYGIEISDTVTGQFITRKVIKL